MKFLLVVFFLVNGQWVDGEAAEGWGPYPYETEAACRTGKIRAEEIYLRLKIVNPRTFEKRFECIADSTTDTTIDN